MSVSITEIVAITGQPGLHKLLKTNDSAIVVESLDEKPKRQLIKGNMMVSKLTDVSIYTAEDSEPLAKVLLAIKESFGPELPVKKNSSNAELMDFLGKVLPDFDAERVYPSNVKKLIGWYDLLLKHDVDFAVEEAAEAEVVVEEVEEKAPAPKAKASKAEATEMAPKPKKKAPAKKKED
ncbi:MAG: DUF5606 domain-containing protein [Bacteroidia bacterium]|nr:DUF5606 domain-containing protein [Bacteroidia bacterium]